MQFVTNINFLRVPVRVHRIRCSFRSKEFKPNTLI